MSIFRNEGDSEYLVSSPSNVAVSIDSTGIPYNLQACTLQLHKRLVLNHNSSTYNASLVWLLGKQNSWYPISLDFVL